MSDNDILKDLTEAKNLAHEISLQSGVPLLRDLEDLSKSSGEFRPDESEQQMIERLRKNPTPDRVVNPDNLLTTLGSETVTGLFWHHKRDHLILVTISGRHLGIPKSLLHASEMITSTHGFRAIPKDPVDALIAVLRGRRPN